MDEGETARRPLVASGMNGSRSGSEPPSNGPAWTGIVEKVRGAPFSNTRRRVAVARQTGGAIAAEVRPHGNETAAGPDGLGGGRTTESSDVQSFNPLFGRNDPSSSRRCFISSVSSKHIRSEFAPTLRFHLRQYTPFLGTSQGFTHAQFWQTHSSGQSFIPRPAATLRRPGRRSANENDESGGVDTMEISVYLHPVGFAAS